MKILLLLFVALLVAAVAGWRSYAAGGELILHSGEWTIHVSLMLALAGILGLGVALYLIVEGVHYLIAMPGKVRNARARSKHNQVTTLCHKAQCASIECRHTDAYKHLTRALALEPHPAVHLQAAACCAALRDWEHWEEHLKAITEPAYKAAAERLHLRGLLASGAYDAALAVLMERTAKGPEPAELVDARMQCLAGLCDWTRMLDTVGTLKPEHGLTQNAIHDYAASAARGAIGAARSEELPALWERFPAGVRSDCAVLTDFAHALRTAATRSEAFEQHVIATIERTRDADWCALAAALPQPGPSLLSHMQKLHQHHPGEPHMALLCAQLHMRNQNYEAARTLLVALAESAPSAAVYRELTLTLLMLGETQQATDQAQRALTVSE